MWRARTILSCGACASQGIKGRAMMTRRRAAFTRVELLLVLAIVVMAVGVAVPHIAHKIPVLKQHQDMLDNAGKNKMRAYREILNLANACDLYEMDMGEYPNSLSDLVTNPGAEGWRGPYLKKPVVPKDPWAKDYRYTRGNDSFEIRTTSVLGEVITSREK